MVALERNIASSAEIVFNPHTGKELICGIPCKAILAWRNCIALEDPNFFCLADRCRCTSLDIIIDSERSEGQFAFLIAF